MEKIYGMHKLVGLKLFWSGTPTFSSGTPTFCQMGVLSSCFQNPSESIELNSSNYTQCAPETIFVLAWPNIFISKRGFLRKVKGH